jgi:ubiquinone/menaquinone biosynthesis C-methylase UbiE
MSLEIELDKHLKIKTNGRDDSNSNFTNYPYEATPYVVLQTLANSGYLKKNDKLIDYGCGKGRVSFYLAYSNKCNMIGVEYDERLYNSALENKKRAISSNRVEFVYSNASDYKVACDIVGAYFFNPFSIQVLKDVLKNIKESKKDNEREIKLFFYYPSKEYLNLLDGDLDIVHIEDVDCMDLFNTNDKREIIAIYKI